MTDADDTRFEVGTLLQDTVALMRWNRWRIAVALAILAGIGILADLAGADVNVGNLLYNIAALFFELWLTVSLLKDSGNRAVGAGGFGALFAVSLIGQLCIVLGLILLVIPGVILLVRWSLGVPIVLSERVSAIEALRESWRATEGRFWPVFAVLLIVYLPLGVLAMGTAAITAESAPTVSAIALNLSLSVMLVTGWHAAVAMFLAAQVKPQSLEEVFA
ncbi:MAG TPA: hypothetical protein VF079_02740 [Sphingomicrobium sp.]